MSAPMATESSGTSPMKRKRSAPDSFHPEDASDALIRQLESSPSRKRKKQTRSQLFDDDYEDTDSNVATTSWPSLADTNTATATIADTTTPFTDASSRASTGKARPKIYHCTFSDCNKVFDRPIRLQAHINSHTGERPHKCSKDDCDKSFYKPEHLNRHMKEKHGNATFVCTFEVRKDNIKEIEPCGKTFESASKLKRHVAAHEDKEETTCSWEGCAKVFRKQETLQRHIKKDHLNEHSYQCTRETADGSACGTLFPTLGLLKSHYAADHEAPKYVCDICTDAMVTPTRDEVPALNDLDPEFLPGPEDLQEPGDELEAKMLDNLSLKDAGPPRMKGPPGVVCFPTYHDLQRHNKYVHPPVCTECGKKCKSNRDLAAHVEIQHPPPGTIPNPPPQPNKKYLCPQNGCPRSLPGHGFSKRGNMDVHFKSAHAKKRDFVCGEHDLSGNKKVEGWNGRGCGVAMTAKQALIAHIRTQHMGLPTNGKEPMKPRKRITAKKGTDADMDIDTENAGPSTVMAMLTGDGYEELRPYACLLSRGPHGCQMRFAREYDLCTHLELTHGWNVDDINDALNASSGAQDPSEDDTFRQQLETGMAAMERTDGAAVEPDMAE
ncbi:Zinc finger [Lecanosticta acicola]|uniref:Zinc finger n=1 Tax=Lecanosticta acicola TaxID=111012 RepID=A0AAI9EBK3_9PEZI|nr:Zinc finger [Lecanosticta acicola]